MRFYFMLEIKLCVSDAAQYSLVAEFINKLSNANRISTEEKQLTETTQVVNDVDDNGLPWDARIHSANRALVNGSWKLRRGITAKYAEEITNELRRMKSIMENVITIKSPLTIDDIISTENPENSNLVANVNETQLEAEQILIPEKIVEGILPVQEEAPLIEEALIPVPPEVVLPSPDAIKNEFQKLMELVITGLNTGKINKDVLDKMLATFGLKSISDARNAPETISQLQSLANAALMGLPI